MRADGGKGDLAAVVVRAVELSRPSHSSDERERADIAAACEQLLASGPVTGGIEVRLNDGDFGWLFYSQSLPIGNVLVRDLVLGWHFDLGTPVTDLQP